MTSRSASLAVNTSVVCATRRYQVDAAKVKTMTGVICARLGVEHHELAIRFVGSTAIRRLNREFRRIDKATDVLSFPQIDWPKPVPLVKSKASQPLKGGRKAPAAAGNDLAPADVLGDLVISLPDAALNAKRIGQTLPRELGFLLVHGILHLCGYDHMNSRDEQTMRKAQRVLMRSLSGPGGKKPLWTGSVKPRNLRRTHAH